MTKECNILSNLLYKYYKSYRLIDNLRLEIEAEEESAFKEPDVVVKPKVEIVNVEE